MAALSRKQTVKNLKKKGFVDGLNRASHHIFLELYHEDQMILFTKVSHGGEIHDRLVAAMAGNVI